jgi:hypothetical protein
LSNLETALRAALAKGDTSDPAFREKVYTAAANAMERSLTAKGVGEGELVAARKRLASVIAGLEGEYRGAPPARPVPPVAEQTRTHPVQARPAPRPGSERREPMLDMPGDEPTLVARPRPGTDQGPNVELADDRRIGDTPRMRRRPFSAVLAVVAITALLIVGFGFAYLTGAFQSAQERDTSVPNPPARLEDEDGPAQSGAPALAGANVAAEEGWITLFRPADPTVISLSGGAAAAVTSDPFGDYARLTLDGSDSVASITVPIGVLLELQGKPVNIALTARTDEGPATGIAVTCDFGALGGCGRKRFSIGQAPSEFVFRVDLPEVSEITGPGAIQLRASPEAQPGPVDLLNMRIRAVSQ